MRLTLRTMLAYMDEILDPEDAQEIGQKIEESEYASGLLQRARDCMRRLRLGAPAISKQGKGLDPNTVAGYLDNTLDPDRVADFERVCLESDVHLAEVASCHQILTMVLGEPAEVDSESRLRMYALSEQVAANPSPPNLPAGSQPAKASEKTEPPPAVPERDEPKLPDYLRAEKSRKRRVRFVVAAAAVVALAVGFLIFSGQGAALVARLTGSGRRVARPVEEPAPLAASVPTTVAGSEAVVADVPIPPATAAPEAPAPAVPEAVVPTPPETEPAPEPAPETVASIPAQPAPAPQMEASPEPAKAGAPAEPAPLPKEPVGKYVSPTQVLLRLNAEQGTWWRLADQASLESFDVIVALPTYRPLIVLEEEIRLLLVDGTRVELLPTEAPGVPGLAIEHGRLVIRPASRPDVRLRLQIGDRTGVVTFADAESALAIEVARRGNDGADPETEPAPLVADLFATSGTITWEDRPSAEAIAVNAPGRLTLNNAPLAVAAAEALPAWVGASTASLLDQRASGTVQSLLGEDRTATLVLRELAGHRQREVRRLALRCLNAIAEFEPLVQTLDDPDHKMIWPDYFCVDLLRSAIRRNPRAAAAVRAAIDKLHRQEGTDLYETLWRYGPDNLNQQDAQRLVGYLNSDTLALRRLSFWNLKRITGMGLYYRPEDSAAERRSSVEKWKGRVKDLQPARPAASGE